jgi:hypothetical protein
MAILVKGDSVILSIWDGSDSYDPVICLRSNSLNETKNIIESQTKCDPGQIVKTPGSYTYEISLEGEYGYDSGDFQQYDDLRTKLVAGTLIEWQISGFFSDGSTGNSYYGSGYLSEVSHDASAGDEIVTFSATLTGDGKTAITTTAPNP